MPEVRFNVLGQVTLVIGGNSGIGRAIALGLWHRVHVGVAGKDPEQVACRVAEIKKCGSNSYGTVVDATRLAEVKRLVAEVHEHLGPIDILVNSVGIFPRSTVLDMPESDWDLAVDTNAKSVFLASQAVLPSMIERKQGRIISMTSGLPLTGAPRGSSYAAAKGAIDGFTRSLAKEVADKGITVNAIAPGLTDTAMVRGSNSPEYIAQWVKTAPGGRLGQPEDVVGLALFMVSEGAKDITGKVVVFR